MAHVSEAQRQRLISFLENRDALDVYGNSLLIYHKNQEVFRHYAGTQPDTLYRVFSMTKVLTVTAALQLFERGLFTMDDPLWYYIPEYKNMTVWDEAAKKAIPAKREIRIRDLFCMSAGLTYPGDDCETARQLASIAGGLEAQHPGQRYSTLQLVRAAAKAPLRFEPGTHWNYSLCHDVLGGLIEVLSGQTLGEYMSENIFEPLGMKDTFFHCPASEKHRIMKGKPDFPGDVMFEEGAKYEAGGAGLLSTLDDYMKFANTLTMGGTNAEGVRILGRKTIDLMRMDQMNAAQKTDFNWDYLTGYSYGLGVRTMIDPAKAGIPGSVGEFGWCGMMGTWVLMDPQEQLTIVYMHQRMPNLQKYVQTHLRSMIYALL